MKLGRIAILLLLVAGLGAYLYWVEMPRERQAQTEKQLLAVDGETITGIDLVFPDREIGLAKTDGAWRLTKPIDAPADDAAVKAVVSALTSAQVDRSLDDVPADLKPFGLDAPDPLVKLTASSGTVPSVAVGKNTAIGGKTYVRRGDEKPILLTASTLKAGLNKQPKDLRDKQILRFQDDDVTQVDIAPAGGDALRIERKDKDAWTVEPGGHVADPTEVRSYLSALRSARAVDFPAADAPDTGLDAPRLTISVATGKDDARKTQTLLLGNELTAGTQKQVYAKRGDEPTIYAVGDWSFRTLGKDASQLRDKTILGFDSDRISRIVLERKEGTGATLLRGPDQKWKVEGATEQVREGAITRFVEDLRDLRGNSIAAEPATDLAAFGLNAPDLKLTLLDKDGQPLGTVLAAKRDGKYFAMREGATTVFEVRDYMYTRLDKQQRDFLGPEPAPAPAPPGVGMPPGMHPGDDAGGFEDEDGPPDEE